MRSAQKIECLSPFNAYYSVTLMKGILYRFECRQTGKFYIGSTTQDIKKRLKNHKSKAKEEHRRNTPLYSHVNSVGWDSMKIIIVAEREIESISQLLQFEKDEVMKYITSILCLNHNRPLRTEEEKRQQDVDYGKKRRNEQPEREYNRVTEWRKNNPEKYKEQLNRSVERQRAKRREAKNNLENNTN